MAQITCLDCVQKRLTDPHQADYTADISEVIAKFFQVLQLFHRDNPETEQHCYTCPSCHGQT